MGLRARQRLEAMKRVQQIAVDVFRRDGFENVRVEEIAESAAVSPVSVYRWFGTKEGLVLWDEFDPPLFEAIKSHLATGSPVDAVRDGLIDEFDRMYDGDRALVLDRARLIYAEPALMSAAVRQQSQLADGLVALFGETGVPGTAFEHRVVASGVVGVLTACIGEWTVHDGDPSLGDLITDGFESLRSALCQP